MRGGFNGRNRGKQPDAMSRLRGEVPSGLLSGFPSTPSAGNSRTFHSFGDFFVHEMEQNEKMHSLEPAVEEVTSAKKGETKIVPGSPGQVTRITGINEGTMVFGLGGSESAPATTAAPATVAPPATTAAPATAAPATAAPPATTAPPATAAPPATVAPPAVETPPATAAPAVATGAKAGEMKKVQGKKGQTVKVTGTNKGMMVIGRNDDTVELGSRLQSDLSRGTGSPMMVGFAICAAAMVAIMAVVRVALAQRAGAEREQLISTEELDLE